MASRSKQLCSSHHCCHPHSVASRSVPQKKPEMPGQPGRSGEGNSSARPRGRAQWGAQAVKGAWGGFGQSQPGGLWETAATRRSSLTALGPRAHARRHLDSPFLRWGSGPVFAWSGSGCSSLARFCICWPKGSASLLPSWLVAAGTTCPAGCSSGCVSSCSVPFQAGVLT